VKGSTGQFREQQIVGRLGIKKASKKGAKKRILETSEDVTAAAPPRPKALVFVSHDSRDANLAEAFANLLSDVSAGTLKSFRSSDKKGVSGIEFGAEWYATIMLQLDEATDVVALLTAQSIDRPWILYEAGVAKGKLETTVFGIALGVPLEKVSTGPFGQFQNCGDDEDSLTQLVMQLLQRNPDAAPREEAVRTQVRVFRDNVDRILKTRGATKVIEAPASEEQNIAKLFEEVKAMVRELPERVDERVASASRPGISKRRINPAMLEQLMFSPLFERGGASVVWLIFLSLVRDDVPWLYEPGMDFYRAVQARRPTEVQRAQENLLRIVDFAKNSKLLYRIMRNDGEETHFLLRHLDEFIHRILGESQSLFNEVAAAKPVRARLVRPRTRS
jgi:hypothetical protein